MLSARRLLVYQEKAEAKRTAVPDDQSAPRGIRLKVAVTKMDHVRKRFV
jgi:hypothetical protein